MKKKGPVTLQIVYRKVGDLVPDVRNCKHHPEEQVDEIVASIKATGFNDPIGIDGDNLIIEGGGRLLAARKLYSPDYELPCVDLSHLTKRQKELYAIAHNKIAEHSRWDMKMLSMRLSELDAGPLDLTLTGFGKDELEKLLTFDPEPQDKPEKGGRRICCPFCHEVFDPAEARKNKS